MDATVSTLSVSLSLRSLRRPSRHGKSACRQCRKATPSRILGLSLLRFTCPGDVTEVTRSRLSRLQKPVPRAVEVGNGDNSFFSLDMREGVTTPGGKRERARIGYPSASQAYERRRIRNPRNTSPRKVAFPCKSFCRSVDYHLRLSIMHASLIGSKRAHPPFGATPSAPFRPELRP